MKWPQPLVQGIFLKRYKRFFADVQIADMSEPQVVHVANTGSLKSVLSAGRPCLLSPATNPERKLRWSLEAIQAEDNTWIGINTAWPNKLGLEIFNLKLLKHWQNFTDIQSEVKINSQTRLDLCLTSNTRKHYVEIKNVTLKVGKKLCFPDAVTERGQKHLQELMELIEQGHGAEILFIAQRTDGDIFSAAAEIDPEYANLLLKAKKSGVLITALSFRLQQTGIEFHRQLQVDL